MFSNQPTNNANLEYVGSYNSSSFDSALNIESAPMSATSLNMNNANINNQYNTPNLNNNNSNNNLNNIGGSNAVNGLGGVGVVDYDNEPPLLEELGIDFRDIAYKTLRISIPTRETPILNENDTDLAGPLIFACALGIAMLGSGKVNFGYIYGFGLIGVLAMYSILNLMSPSNEAISIDRTTSILGYSLLPIVILAVINIVFDLRSLFGLVLCLVMISWCTFNSTRLFEKSLFMRQQRYLIAYPTLMLYATFALLTVF